LWLRYLFVIEVFICGWGIYLWLRYLFVAEVFICDIFCPFSFGQCVVYKIIHTSAVYKIINTSAVYKIINTSAVYKIISVICWMQ
jgi:hypothetical protein